MAEQAASAVVRLEPGSANAHHALANMQFHIRRDLVSAEENYRKALALESNAYALFEYGWLLSQTGRYSEAVAALEKAVELDPRSPLIHDDLGWWLYGARQYERAIAEARFAIDLDPTFPEAYWLLSAAHAEQGRFDLALQEFERYESLHGRPVLWFHGYLLGLAGRRADALRDLAELKRRVERGASAPIEPAQIHLGLGDREAVLETLERAPEAGVSFQPYLWPEYETYHSDPRFRAALEKFSLPLRPSRSLKIP
jgi:tetratricopeptide (TPR) repeat protein